MLKFGIEGKISSICWTINVCIYEEVVLSNHFVGPVGDGL
jgi:hypothetical protein